ncbi:glycosyltransferase [Bifidobacterium sp. ESL0728]|uniref:glycosyltransferase n=1 Tax=Bifidobacterium sp. ESL0728 TaxID=2983220 RepID=UPI0023F7EF7B|nr:glycosyltransferase [Bifidobacterium sp. ESL0728]WEV58323.1 glycosyltransferase [Bifidobacterium sp. ESL0728]
MNTSSRSFPARHKTAIFALLAAAVILLLECFAFNLQFWSTLGASRDSVSALNTLGPGLSRQKDGTLLVTDPSSAFLTTKSDGSSPYIRIDPAESTFRFTSPSEVLGFADASQNMGSTAKGKAESPLTAFHIRVDAAGYASPVRSVSTVISNSRYLRIPHLNSAQQTTDIKVWVDEPAGTHVDIAAVHANVRVPFHASWGRVAAMATIVLLIALWMPSSALWRMRLDTASIRQRLVFAGFMLIVGAFAALSIVQSIWAANSSAFHEPGNYTYDFNQYDHLSDSLLHGKTSIDLPVPQALKTAQNPYDPQTREMLLNKGVTPIYWDYSYYQGHWYSYFGVLPALLIFAPYRLVTSLFIPGGLALPAGVAVSLLLFVFVLFGSLLVIRLLKTLNPKTSLATVSMAITLFLLGSQVGYLAFRMNFYSVPFAASLALSVMGLWFWLGSKGYPDRTYDKGKIKIRNESKPISSLHDTPKTEKSSRRHLVAIGDASPLSWPHLAAGSLCLAANFGCRPTFTLVALLAFPIFWPQIRSIFTKSSSAEKPVKRRAIINTLIAVLLPALVVVVPLCIYNYVRFGSPIDFGERYQITVADMTHYRNSPANLLPTLGYYLFLPLRFSREFPFLAINPTPLASWSYTEPLVGGLFVLCPVLLLVVLLLVPGIRRRIRRSGLLRIVLTMLPLALLLLLVDIFKGGIGWRYMVDFGWLVALAAVVVAGAILGDARPCRNKTILNETSVVTDHGKSSSQPNPRNQFGRLRIHRQAASPTLQPRIDWGCVAVRLFMSILLLLSITVAFLIIFVPGREDALTRTNPALFQAVASWFVV